MLNKIFPIALLTAMLSSNALFARQAINVAAVDKPPQMDGKLNDSCWRNQKWHSNFTILNNPSQKAKAQTSFKIVHDNKNLYVIAKLDEPLMNKLKAKVTKHDGKVYLDDCLEIFIDVNNTQADYYHFAINSLGTVYDAQCRQGGSVSTPEWNASGLKTAILKYTKYWIIEMAIPFADLEIEPNNSGRWGVNIARERQGKLEYSSFMPFTGGFHQPAKFGLLNLKNVNLKAFFWEIKAPYAVKTVSSGGKIFLKNKLFVKNDTGKFRFIKIKSKLLNCNKSQVANLGLADKTGGETEIMTPARVNGNTQLSVKIINRRNGSLLATRFFPLSVQYSPLRIDLTQPCYRNCIFATQTIKELKGKVISDCGSLEQTALQLQLKDSAGKTIDSQILKKLKRVNSFSMPIPSLESGSYYLCAELQKNNRVIFSKQITIKKLPPFKGEVRIDKNLVTRIDGKPFLPYGWFSFADDFKTARQQGYNTYVYYSAYYRSDAELKKWLDKSIKNGIKVLIYPYPQRKYNNPKTWQQPLSPRESSEIRDFVRKWKSHPAILGWYMADEPELRPALTDRMEAIRKICLEEDPYHPCILLNDTITGIHKYIKGGDVFNPDPYPLFLKNKNAAKPIEKVGKFIKEIYVAGKNEKAAWVTPQGFNYGDYGVANNRAPNFVELRNMQYQAIIAGATGFTWYAYQAAKTYPALILGVEFLCKEAKLLKDIVLSPQKRTILKTGDKYIKAVYYKGINNHDWIVAVNNATTFKNVKLRLPGEAAKKWYVVSEKRKINTNGKTLRDKFGVYATHIYTTDRKTADKLSIFEIQNNIKQQVAARRYPGNLAQGKNVKITASSRNKWWSPLSHVVNGMRTDSAWRASKKGSSWLELNFPQKIEWNEIIIHSPSAGNIFVQIKSRDTWGDIAKLKLVAPGKLSAKVPLVTSSSIRILFKDKQQKLVPQIREIEVYKKIK